MIKIKRMIYWPMPHVFRFAMCCLRRLSLLLSVSVIACVSGSGLAETPAPPVSDGLLAYFDSSTVILSEPNSDKVADWPSSVGNLVTSQGLSLKQPKRVKVGERQVVRFDGEDDNLRVEGLAKVLNAATIFVVAAPHENAGDFRGLLALNEPNCRDYESGLNIDLGPIATDQFAALNVEGKGFRGAVNLIRNAVPFGKLHIIETIVNPHTELISVRLNGQFEGKRPFQVSTLSAAELTIGARFCTHGPGEQQARSSFQGDIAAILLYDRVLSDEESKRTYDFLRERFVKLNDALRETLPQQLQLDVPLVKAVHPAPVQILVPGFEAREIPVSLTNVNNVRYRHDGKLVTLGYNGDVHLLSDTDGDGLEDTAHLYWKNSGSIRGPIGMLVAPPAYPHGRGVLLASKGKVSMIIDQNGDDLGDEELIVATGWQEIPQNVDAVGLAMGNDGSLYFGLGTANYANPYLVDKNGIAAYDLKSERGTVQKISPDWSRRETVCTGIRFPIAFGFHHSGELFCTEQEGATWLPNGNPLDELLHIRLDGQAPSFNVFKKRHYGFPPRHPRHNPNVIDEPSTMDYGPQHQSTCGMVFNEPVNGGPTFGPLGWRGDAIVCGESRGKLWRTKLVSSPFGFVAENQLIACLQMLTVDACVAPNGDLVVACHSGPPDWGTGPQGQGKLFRIRMTDSRAPRPVACWAASPTEIQIAFDQPVDTFGLQGFRDKLRVEYGEFVRAGDRFENLVPPYAVVKQQQQQPRYEARVNGLTVSQSQQLVTIYTSPLVDNVSVAASLPLGNQTLDVDLGLNGVSAVWQSNSKSEAKWTGILPHLDLNVSRQLWSDSVAHQTAWSSFDDNGTLTLDTFIDVRNMLRAPVQRGSQLDFDLPAEIVRLQISGGVLEIPKATGLDGSPHGINVEKLDVAGGISSDPLFEVSVDTAECTGFIRLIVKTQTGEQVTKLRISYSTSEDDTQRPLEKRRFLLPWVNLKGSKALSESTCEIPELAGGSWGRGKHLFYDERTLCSKCHAIHGNGAKIGPDLGNLIHRDFSSVMRDITEPSFAINPDYLGFAVTTKEGEVYTGVARSENDELYLSDNTGRTVRVRKDEIDKMKPMATSIMPAGLLDKLTAEEKRDLLTYLIQPAPSMPLTPSLKAPAVRTRAEVEYVIAQSQELKRPLKSIKLILVDGAKDHGPGEHDYPAWQLAWRELLRSGEELQVSTARDFPSAEQLAWADVIIFFQRGSFTGIRATQIDQFLKRGGGIVLIHWAVEADARASEFAERVGLASYSKRTKYRHGPLTLDISKKDHPIMRNFERIQLYDESYWDLVGDPKEIQVLATSQEDGKMTPQIWVVDHKPGRVFVSIPGHYNWTFDDPLFRVLLLRGIAWTVDEPIDRFNDLIWPGARLLDN